MSDVSTSLAARQVLKLVKNFSDRGRVLEAGCGHGGYVLAFHQSGWEVVGVDFAEKTVSKNRRDYPHLDIRFGDVRDLHFSDASFDVYYSGGVIEHFWNGYSKIISEAYRVLKQGGVGFFSFPAMNMLRKLKASRGLYQRLDSSRAGPELPGFYQFALDPTRVSSDLVEAGFIVEGAKWKAGAKGLADEFKPFRSLLEASPRLVRGALARSVGGARIWGHSVTLVVRKPREKV